MKINVYNLEYKTATAIIFWCIENKIDYYHACLLAEEMCHLSNSNRVDWNLDIPDKFLPWLILKFG